MADAETQEEMGGDLLERLEKAQEGSRDLDYAIWSLFWGDYSHPLDNYPAYTTSLDCALTLVPEGWLTRDANNWLVSGPSGRLWAWCLENGAKVASATALTPALALCIAALKARSAS